MLLVGSDHKNGTLKPWNLVAGSLGDLDAPLAVAVDDTYFKDLGVEKNGETAEINGVRVKIAAVTHGIRSFTTLPYVFTSLKLARMLIDAGSQSGLVCAGARRPRTPTSNRCGPISSPACRIARC